MLKLKNKNYLTILIIITLFTTPAVSFGEVVNLEPVEKNKLTLPIKNELSDKNLVIKDRNVVEDLIKMQKEEEVKDIELLWRATIDNNTLIKFTMNKLNTPESQRRLHSSVMAKSLSALIYGASFLPMFTGSNTMIQSASFSAGRLANNFINKESSTTSQQAPITDTELIQLAGTIEELQEKIISSYYEYKGALNKLKDTRSRIILYNKNYSNALKNNEITELIVSSALYEDMQLQEYKQEQDAKKYYLSLERLAGKKAVDSLILSQYALKNQLINPEKIIK
ncbi:MAG: hypothetical protein LUG16_06055 [Candidatus Gastranaerophilales bacterium]|nr:hypothetical protein [Candidatus Gastranaerophilales bacterium]